MDLLPLSFFHLHFKKISRYSEARQSIISILINKCACMSHFEPFDFAQDRLREAESRHGTKWRAPKVNLFLIDFSTSGHFVALRSK
jgi:hypothetical protein